MQLISNHKEPTHLKLIKRLLKSSEETIICVAFLKISGLDLLLKQLSNNATFYVGIDYFLTEPSALRKLLSRGYKIFLTKKNNSTYHPKLYYFRRGSDISILIGSANLTGGGLKTNIETSFLIETKRNSRIDRQLKEITKYFEKNSDEIVNDAQISQYERKYEISRQKHKKAEKEIQASLKEIHSIDLSKMDKYVKEYRDDDEYGHRQFSIRKKDYRVAKKLLNEIATKRISSPSRFLELYEQIPFHSSGLLRGKTIYAKKFRTIISIIKTVKKNKNAEPFILFEKALLLVERVKKFGINALTEIMNTYNSNKFSVANGRTIKSLSNLGFEEFKNANNFSAQTYDRYNNLISEINAFCKFKDLGQVDHFLSWYYGWYVKE